MNQYLLLQTGDFFLLQTGDYLILQEEGPAVGGGGGARDAKSRIHSRHDIDDDEILAIVTRIIGRLSP